MKRMDYVYKVRRLVISHKAGDWCRLPYPNHKNGCPNYGKADRCPPKAPMVQTVFDISKPLYLVHSEFDLKSHVGRMQSSHPEWSDRQCRCVLYWQPHSRKQLKDRVRMARFVLGTNIETSCPEGMGVNVYATARLSGLYLGKIKTLFICRHVALLGWRLK